MSSKTIICERCGRFYSTTCECEIHLCDNCAMAICEWLNKHIVIKKVKGGDENVKTA